jgi:hypothetical protein
MRFTLPLLLSALCLAACSKPSNPDAANTPANSPAPIKPAAPLERAYVVTCAPTGDARDLQWFESGKDQPFPGDALNAHIETLSKAGGNWNAAKKCSENRIALRIDARARISEFWRFMDAIAAAGVYKFAVAMLQEFDPPFSNAGGGEPVWELDSRYLPLQLPVDTGVARESKEPEFSLGLNLTWRKQFSRCLLSTNFQRETLPITEVEEVFSALLPAAAEDKRFKRSEQGTYSFATQLTEEALAKAAKRVKGKLTRVQLGEGGEAAKHRDQPGEHAQMAFLFLALDAVTRFNASRAAEKLPPVELQFALGAGRGQFLSKLPEVPKPVEKSKLKVEPWGDPPGELFEPKSAFTVTIEKLEKPAADGAKFAYFWGQSPKPRSLDDFIEEIARYAKQRDVAGGAPGWDKDKNVSRNVLAIRCDIEAPFELANVLMVEAYLGGISRFALAKRNDFPLSDYEEDARSNRPLLNTLAAPLKRYDIDLDYHPQMPYENVWLTFDADSETQQVQTIVAIGARGRKVVEGSSCTLREISPELAEEDAGKSTAAVRRAEIIAAQVAAMESYIERTGAKMDRVEIHGTKFWGTRTAAPIAACFVFAALEAVAELNIRRKAAAKAEYPVSIIDWPPPPEPEMKPQEKVEYPKDEPPEEDPTDEK